MQPRLDFYAASPDALKAMLALENAVSKLPLEKSLIDLVKMRASQINGCAFCLDMHGTHARKAGETERRLYTLSSWRETPFFTPRERAALAWTESLTLISETHASDEDYALLCAEFSPMEMVDLSVAIGTINSWNRLAIGFRKMPVE
ncbi:alkylhydroperoxidase [Pseudomonas agarici]|uniref:Alkylhydroperoxidase n=1 Tax=Pseudomonas agarici TaxID=46677 RepID=A0A0X1T260_PSEAA|nr:carboxymuconolactone decarboxylase family protein [Pseudomonas agarici]AMB86134.1 alkylhydroperoxidase [Pseudomonas agarici]NWB93998.1 carboxymuconolactone decarboxylase family protein [Pseudomonas agarici]NWC10491.1 carboxymuconolactone decarboxylase family protein [Pseudomonas agarici]SEL39527.1 alkylhydroperoxidase AhpD family core domain-containing protein [Pseudomonas agarici]